MNSISIITKGIFCIKERVKGCPPILNSVIVKLNNDTIISNIMVKKKKMYHYYSSPGEENERRTFDLEKVELPW